MGSMVILILFCFLFSHCYLISTESKGVHGNFSSKEKNFLPTHMNVFARAHYSIERHANLSSEINENMIGHSAMCRTQEGRFYGLRAKIGVWGSENIGHSQVSGACIAAFSQQAEGVNTFEVGFHVFPELYNNSDVHFYTFWTRDAYSKTGCYNLRCPGFVPASGAALYPGQAVAPTSSYNGEDRYIIISLHTDPDTGDWVVYRDDLDTPSFLGHFPRDLCPDMTGSASRVAWSGFVSYPKNGRGPPMGSGHFAEEGDRRAAYFKNMKLFDSKGHAQDPVPSSLECMADRLECYDRSLVYLAVKDGYLFYYGGPAGCVG